jgi:hypothetical protein
MVGGDERVSASSSSVLEAPKTDYGVTMPALRV